MNAHLPTAGESRGRSVVTIDPSTGEILAMVGGRGLGQIQVNLATMRLRRRSVARAPGGFVVQAVHARRGAQQDAGYDLNAYWQGPASITITEHDVRHGRRAVGAVERR